MKTKSKHLFFIMLLVIFFNRQLVSQNPIWTIGEGYSPKALIDQLHKTFLGMAFAIGITLFLQINSYRELFHGF